MKKFLKLFSLFVAPFIILGCGSSDDDGDNRTNHLADATYTPEDNVDKTDGYYAVKKTDDTTNNTSYTAKIKNPGLDKAKATNIEINGIGFSNENGGTVKLSAYKGTTSVDVTISLAGQDSDQTTEDRKVKVQIAGGTTSNFVDYKKDGVYTVSIDIDPSGNTAKVYVWNVASDTEYTATKSPVQNGDPGVTKSDGTGVELTVTTPGTKVKALYIGEPKIKAAATSPTS